LWRRVCGHGTREFLAAGAAAKEAEIPGISAQGRPSWRGRNPPVGRGWEGKNDFYEKNLLTWREGKARILFSTTIFPRRFQNSKKI